MERLPPQLRHQLSQFQQTQQQAQALMFQKQQLEFTLRETERAIGELEKLKEGTPIYRTLGGILVKADRPEVEKELNERRETLDLRIKTIERQEGRVIKRLNEMRAKLQDVLKARGPSGEAG